MSYIIAEWTEREAAPCWTVWCTRCVTTGSVRSTLKEVTDPWDLDGRKLMNNLQGDPRVTTGWGTPRLETKTSSWTCWRRPTLQSTGLSGSTKWVVWKFILLCKSQSPFQVKDLPNRGTRWTKQHPRFYPWKTQARPGKPGISIYLYTPCDANVEKFQPFFSPVHFPCDVSEFVRCVHVLKCNSSNVQHFNIISFITVIILFYLINLSVFQMVCTFTVQWLLFNFLLGNRIQ